jgi:hypothetical protein
MSARLLCSFNSTGTSFALLSHDQRLKIFSVLSQSLSSDATPPNHLTAAITALAFPAAASGKTRAPTGPAAPLLALGTKSGDILLWHVAKGSVEQTVGAGGAHRHTAAIQALAFSPNGNFLFSCGSDRTVKQWNVSNGSFVTNFDLGGDESSGSVLTHLALSPNGELLLAGGNGALVLWHLSNPSTPLRDFRGPTDRISCVAFSPDSKYVISGAADRFLTLWSAEEGEHASGAEGEKKKKKKHRQAEKNVPVHTFTLQTAPISVQFNVHTAKGTYEVAALSDSSLVSVLQWSPPAAASSSASAAAAASSAAASPAPASSSTPVCLISIPHASGQSEAARRRDEHHKSSKHKHKSTAASSTLLPGEEGDAIGSGVVQAVQFNSATTMTVARGDAVRPHFQQVVFAKDGGGFEAEIVLPKYQHSHLMTSSAGAAATPAAAADGKKRKHALLANEPVIIGAQHQGDTTMEPSLGLDESREKKQKLAGIKSKSDGELTSEKKTRAHLSV